METRLGCSILVLFMILIITAEHNFCLQVREVFWRQYSIEHTSNGKGFMLCRRKQEVGEWLYLPLTEAILTQQAVQSVKEQMRDWNRANALHCTTSCSMVSPDWSLFCFRALIHWLIDAFKPIRSLWTLFSASPVTDIQEGCVALEIDHWNFWQ